MTLVFTGLLSEGLNRTQDHALANDQRLGREQSWPGTGRPVCLDCPCGVNGLDEKAGVPACLALNTWVGRPPANHLTSLSLIFLSSKNKTKQKEQLF